MADEPLRVVNLIHERKVGGPHIRVALLAREMLRYGIETTVAIPPGPGVRYFEERDVPCEPISFQRLRRARMYRSAASSALLVGADTVRLAALLRSRRASVLHVNSIITLIGPPAGRLGGAKVLWHLNDTTMPRSFYAIALTALGKFTDQYIFASGAVSSYAGLGPCEEADIMYPPVAMERFASLEPGRDSAGVLSRLGLDPEVPTVVNVSNINGFKGQPDLVEAVALCRIRGVRLQVILVGKSLDADEDSRLHKLVTTAGLEDAVRFIGYSEKVEEYLGAAAIFVLPSWMEAMPIALLEGMASGLPCVSTPVGGVEEILDHGKNGLLVPIRSPIALSRALEKLALNIELRKRLGEQARRSVRDIFSTEAIAKRQARKYYSMVGRPDAIN